jgi:hypothetical protein
MYKIIFAGAVIAFLYGATHYWLFLRRLEEARMRGQIPLGLLRQRMGIAWMIGSPGIVAGGDNHRRKAMWGIGIFVALWIVLALLSIFHIG